MTQAFNDRTPLQRLLWLGGMAKAAGGKGVEETASGNPVVFTTDLARPLSRLALSLLPRQSGTGDPSPENIRPLLPWGEVGTWTGGKNLLDINELWDNGTNYGSGEVNRYYKLTVPNGKYTVSTNVPNNTNPAVASVFVTDRLETPTSGYNGVFLNTPRTINITTKELYIFIRVSSSGGYRIWDKTTFADYYVQVEIGQTATAYEEAHITPHPVDLTGITPPVYGCELGLTTGEVWGTWADKAVSETRPEKKADHIFQFYFSDRKYGQGLFGVISDSYKTHTNVASTGSTIESLYAQYGDGIYINSGSGTFYICDSNYTEVDDFKTAMADARIAYELATPVLLATLTPQQISAIVGVNTVWSDADNVDVTYLKKG